MKQFIPALLALLFFGTAAQTATASTNGVFKWEHFNVAPYATTHDLGMSTRQKAFGCLGIPQGAIDLLMKETENAGDRTHPLNVGDHLDGMLSKGCKLNRDVTVAFKAPVHNMDYAAPNSRWSVVWEGKRYTVILPDICNNWSLVVEVLPLPPVAQAPEPCERAHLFVSIPPGGQFHQQMVARRPLPQGACNTRTLKFLDGGRGKYYKSCGDQCLMEDSIADLKREGYLIALQPGTGFMLTCRSPNGCVLDEGVPMSATQRTDDDIWLNCFSMADGTRSLVKDIHWRSFKPNPAHNGQMEAYIVFAPEQAPPEWVAAGGLPHVWKQAPDDGQQPPADDAQASDAPANSAPDNGDPNQQ